jgi:hypothetical protein
MHSPKISLIVPHYPFPDTDEALNKLLTSCKGQYDELILVVNDRMGYGPAVNMGLKWASGDFLIVSNNDIEVISGSLRHLPFTPGFSIPTIKPEPKDYKPRAIFCLPRWIYTHMMDNYGYFYDPVYELGYFEDDDLHMRMGDIPSFQDDYVTVIHHGGGGLTMKMMGEQEWFNRNQKIFKSKWHLDTYS